MNVSEVVRILELEVYSGKEGLDKEVSGAYVSDLLSDVMGNALEGNLWITLQTHINTMAVASLKDLSAVMLISGHKPNAETISKSNEEGIPMLGSKEPAFVLAGKLYKLLHEE